MKVSKISKGKKEAMNLIRSSKTILILFSLIAVTSVIWISASEYYQWLDDREVLFYNYCESIKHSIDECECYKKDVMCSAPTDWPLIILVVMVICYWIGGLSMILNKSPPTKSDNSTNKKATNKKTTDCLQVPEFGEWFRNKMLKEYAKECADDMNDRRCESE